MSNRTLSIAHACLVGSLTLATLAGHANAGTRILFHGEGNQIVTGRTMDSCQNPNTNVWIFPRGIERDGACGPNSLKWTAQFGSLVLSANDGMTVDGMNESGLVVNAILLPETNFGTPDGRRPLICSTVWAQWVLDSFGTVRDAVATLQSENFCLVAPASEMARFSCLAISDPTGDSALMGWSDGKLTIHFGKEFGVVTGATCLNRQVAMNGFMKEFGTTSFPGNVSDCPTPFVRAFSTLNSLPTSPSTTFGATATNRNFAVQANTSVLGALRTLSTPFGVCDSSRPEFKPTWWRTVFDQKGKVFHFDCASTMSCFWVPFADLNFGNGAPVRKLTIGNFANVGSNVGAGTVLSGNASSRFETSTPFRFVGWSPN